MPNPGDFIEAIRDIIDIDVGDPRAEGIAAARAALEELN